ncbi:hypothetical protein Q4519_14600 [Motilimonas sp. 1_MG-2023]|uniref:hypothetical protein n=1 Tax=Motilimonas sp. 1_MG-2023 TaxID=3062672 RepID=UPI0026E2E1EA|nr:hypothetical protein [Motilimonas sp. 1_MG-2023]MDO6526913.1 hypothetical protein [Motilimonas sp. 1_MG-2023]
MSEAYGHLYLKSNSINIEKLAPISGERFDEKFLLSVADDLTEVALAAHFVGADEPLDKLRYCYSEPLTDEKDCGFFYIHTQGDNWINLLEAIASSDVDLEIFGYIDHEYGFYKFYSLSNKSRVIKTLVTDTNEDLELAATNVKNSLREAIPDDYLNVLDNLFLDELFSSFVVNNDAEVATAPWWIPTSDEDYFIEVDGIKYINYDMFYGENYQREYLLKAKALGASIQVINGPASDFVGSSYSTNPIMQAITSFDDDLAHRHQVVKDVLEVYAKDIDLNQVYAGYGSWLGTPLVKAIDRGYFNIVAMLLNAGADPAQTEYYGLFESVPIVLAEREANVWAEHVASGAISSNEFVDKTKVYEILKAALEQAT